MTGRQFQGGIDIGGALLAPHSCSDEHKMIHDGPVTLENYEIKLQALRELCLQHELNPDRRLWPIDVMCIIKYGEGFHMAQLPHLYETPPAHSLLGRLWGWLASRPIHSR